MGKVELLGDRIWLEPVEGGDEMEACHKVKKEGGVYRLDIDEYTLGIGARLGRVVKIGGGLVGAGGARGTDLAVGRVVIYLKETAQEMVVEGKRRILVREEDILAMEEE
jgi:co-chaperonin GroES (HSP10)